MSISQAGATKPPYVVRLPRNDWRQPRPTWERNGQEPDYPTVITKPFLILSKPSSSSPVVKLGSVNATVNNTLLLHHHDNDQTRPQLPNDVANDDTELRSFGPRREYTVSLRGGDNDNHGQWDLSSTNTTVAASQKVLTKTMPPPQNLNRVPRNVRNDHITILGDKRSEMEKRVPTATAGHHSSYTRSRPRQSNSTSYRRSIGPVARRQGDWTHWTELAIFLFRLPTTITTKDVWSALQKEGQIITIELFEDTTGFRNGKGRVRFSPPPARAFWQNGKYSIQLDGNAIPSQVEIQLENQKRSFLISSPASSQIKYPEEMTLKGDCLDFGFMYEPATMMAMYRVQPSAQSQIIFRQSMLHREIDISFQLDIRESRLDSPVSPKAFTGTGKRDRIETLRFRIPFAQPFIVHEVGTSAQPVLLISTECPPRFYRKFDEAATHEMGANYWTHQDAWFRQTDILYDTRKLRDAALTLKKSRPIIDIGRWTTYRFTFNLNQNDELLYNQICRALKDFNVDVKTMSDFKLITNREPAVWDYIDKPMVKQKLKNVSGLDELIADTVQPLSFPVRYQLEVCISQGYLNEHNLTREFVNKLMNMKQADAQDILEYVANQKKRIYHPMDLFDVKIIKGSATRLKIPHYCAYTRSATITPSTVYYNTPTVDTSNRVIRQYAEYSDRFLRVRFSDEKFQGRIYSTDKETMNEVFTRIKRTMINGITIGDRHYEFLAFGNSQFREHGAYFFAPVEHLRPEGIRRWMGYFADIRVVAKHAARLGQCFSTTRAINGTKVKIVEIEDIERGKYNFTDGVGKISKFLAQMTASELGLSMPSGEPPSVFQFRLGGCKGVLALSPDIGTREIHIRKSQYKFPASHEGLEIIRWSKPAAAYLNRQLILVLSALQVPDNIFVKMLKQQLSNLERAMIDEKMALNLLQKEIDPNQMTLALAAMVLEGFQRVREPFMLSLLQLWRAWSIKYLKEKAKIVVNKGALLFGCVDETATLKGHFNSKQPGHVVSKEDRLDSLPEVFVQLSKGANDKSEVIKGPIILARNPSLHPGDIRIVRGVDVPALHHLKDAVVLPQTGDRDVSSMCSGGDLDGDDYVVLWDKNLIPVQWNHEAMDYTPPKPVTVTRNITVDDTTSFFVTYMKNDSLPRIARAHLAIADYMDDGVKNDKCLRLAALHSLAVDYVKTGVPAIMPPELRPRKWPHFMEVVHKPKEQIYTSEKVLGQLYEQVERVDFIPEYSSPFDLRILQAYDIDKKLQSDAAEVKVLYDTAMRRVMAQHDIRSEFEVWSTFVLHHANQSKDFKFHEEMGEISTALKDRFRNACYDKAGGRGFDRMGPFVAAMYKVTSDEVNHALIECQRVVTVGGKAQRVGEVSTRTMPLMSFPWLFQSILGKIASGELYSQQEGGTEPFHSEHKKVITKRHQTGRSFSNENTLQTNEGITHRGDILELFHRDEEERSKEEIGVTSNVDMLEILNFDKEDKPYAARNLIENVENCQDSPTITEKHAQTGLGDFNEVSVKKSIPPSMSYSGTLQSEIQAAKPAGTERAGEVLIGDTLLDFSSYEENSQKSQAPTFVAKYGNYTTSNLLDEICPPMDDLNTLLPNRVSEKSSCSSSPMNTSAEGKISFTDIQRDSRSLDVCDKIDPITADTNKTHNSKQVMENVHDRELLVEDMDKDGNEFDSEAEEVLLELDDKPSLLEQLAYLLES